MYDKSEEWMDGETAKKKRSGKSREKEG